MSSTFVCEKCGHNSYEQFSRTQVRCLSCGTVADFDTGFRIIPEFELNKEAAIPIAAPQEAYMIASMSKRIVNYLVDVIVASFIIYFIGNTLQLEISTAKGEMTETGLVIMLVTIPLYYFLMEFVFGKTVGKLITRTRVISADGKRANVFQCLFRSVARLLPFEQFSGLFMGGIFWHDSLPKTLVVED